MTVKLTEASSSKVRRLAVNFVSFFGGCPFGGLSFGAMPLAPGPLFEFGPFCFDSGNHQLLRGTDVIQLPPKAIDTLRLLIEQRGHVVSKEALLDQLWPDTSVESANLTQNIYLIRKALGQGPDDHSYIETLPKRGYRFVAPVTVNAAPSSTVDAAPGVRSDSAVQERPSRDQSPAGTSAEGNVAVASGMRTSTRALASAALLLVVCTGILIRGSVWSRPKPPESTAAVRSLAVLPFKPIGSQPRDELLELGLADALITKLSALRQVVVRPTSAVRRYGRLDQDPLAAGREQRTDLVLEGSIQRAGDRIRVTFRLLDVLRGTALMGETVDVRLTDLFATQDSIAERVAQSLVLTMSDGERARLKARQTTSRDGFRLYMKGRYFWDKRTAKGFEKALASFREAIEQDPASPWPYVGLADAYIAIPFNTDEPPTEALGKARAAATRALEINDTLSEAHAALGFVHATFDWNWHSAEKAYKRALELSPNSSTAHQRYANYFTMMGQHDRAIAETVRTLDLDPVSLATNALAGRTYYFARRYDRTLEQCQKAIELDPHFWVAHFFAGKAYAQKGMYAQAIAALRKAGAVTTEVLATIGYVEAVSNHSREAREILGQLTLRRTQTYVPPSHLAKIHAALGENDQAFAWLNKARDEHDVWLIWLASEPMWDSLRSDPRFGDLLRRLGLPSTPFT
jgi:DNA-binding winged helix-turn-helix (wHTH) protein/TolB-like protein/tetratricopeptide (TPR) repeat protein